MKQTALEELIGYINSFSNDYPASKKQILTKATELLTKERAQIIEAWQDGYANGCSVGGNDYTTETENDTGANFFTTTYKQPL